MARALAAIDVKDLARHEACRFQIEDRAHDLGDFTQPPKWVQLGEPRMRFDGVHRRLDAAGRNRIHSDAELRILDCQRFCRGAQASLRQRGEDGRHKGVRMFDQARGDLYDVAAAPLLHLRNSELCNVKEAREIDAQQGAVIFLSILREWLGDKHARVVDERIDAPNRATPSAIARSAVFRSEMSPGTTRTWSSLVDLIDRAVATTA